MEKPPANLVTARKFAEPVDQELVRRDWRGRGYSCGLFVDPPGRAWNDFVHETNELLVVVKGTLAITIKGRSCTVAAGDEVFIPRHAMHSVRNVNRDSTYWLYGYDGKTRTMYEFTSQAN